MSFHSKGASHYFDEHTLKASVLFYKHVSVSPTYTYRILKRYCQVEEKVRNRVKESL